MEAKNGNISRDIKILNDIELLLQDAQLNIQKSVALIYMGVPRAQALKEVIEVNEKILNMISLIESNMVKVLAGVQFLEFNNDLQEKIEGINL